MSNVSPLRLVRSKDDLQPLKNPCPTTSRSSSPRMTPCDCGLSPCDQLVSLTHSLKTLLQNRPEQAAGLVTLAATLARAAVKVCLLLTFT